MGFITEHRVRHIGAKQEAVDSEGDIGVVLIHMWMLLKDHILR